MYEIFKNIIENGDYKLGRLISKIKKAWAEGELTEQEKEELIALARERANASSEIGLDEVLEMYRKLEERVTALEKNKTPTQPQEEIIEEYVQGKWYYNGDKVTQNGKKYVCVHNQVCVWSPTEYPQGWKEVI